MDYNHFSQFGGLLDKRFTFLRKRYPDVPNRFQKAEGVYILSPRSNPTVQLNSRIKVKIGMSSNVYSRLDQYNTYYPDSFYTYSVILTKNGTYKTIEKAIHKALKDKNSKYLYTHPMYQARIEGEWFYARKYMFLKIINRIIEEYQDDIVMLWNDHDGYFTLEKPEGNTSIKVHNPGSPKPKPPKPPKPVAEVLPKTSNKGYAITENTAEYVTVPRAEEPSWRKDWNPPDLTLNRADRRKKKT